MLPHQTNPPNVGGIPKDNNDVQIVNNQLQETEQKKNTKQN